ncbi:hypothetical protein [Kosakonia sacchari]|uniref:hypothetical protein n=1 Tax=Kosakonia sacchari TaxID=1158459 RepID=UPI000375BF51|nr:hypothetical protein [Kosakonia sacchari]AHJ77503.1 hypothetical protein C813_17140 [Kosakonia sacchari SP1]
MSQILHLDRQSDSLLMDVTRIIPASTDNLKNIRLQFLAMDVSRNGAAARSFLFREFSAAARNTDVTHNKLKAR